MKEIKKLMVVDIRQDLMVVRMVILKVEAWMDKVVLGWVMIGEVGSGFQVLLLAMAMQMSTAPVRRREESVVE
jgi:hypothetical protein